MSAAPMPAEGGPEGLRPPEGRLQDLVAERGIVLVRALEGERSPRILLRTGEEVSFVATLDVEGPIATAVIKGGWLPPSPERKAMAGILPATPGDLGLSHCGTSAASDATARILPALRRGADLVRAGFSADQAMDSEVRPVLRDCESYGVGAFDADARTIAALYLAAVQREREEGASHPEATRLSAFVADAVALYRQAKACRQAGITGPQAYVSVADLEAAFAAHRIDPADRRFEREPPDGWTEAQAPG